MVSCFSMSEPEHPGLGVGEHAATVAADAFGPAEPPELASPFVPVRALRGATTVDDDDPAQHQRAGQGAHGGTLRAQRAHQRRRHQHRRHRHGRHPLAAPGHGRAGLRPARRGDPGRPGDGGRRHPAALRPRPAPRRDRPVPHRAASTCSSKGRVVLRPDLASDGRDGRQAGGPGTRRANVVGLGLIGGSVGLALRARGLARAGPRRRPGPHRGRTRARRDRRRRAGSRGRAHVRRHAGPGRGRCREGGPRRPPPASSPTSAA